MFSIREAARAFINSLRPKQPYVRKPGAGHSRAAVRLASHSRHQAARVAPALPVLATRRAELARKRVKRWQAKESRTLDLAPSHIKRMSREQRA